MLIGYDRQVAAANTRIIQRDQIVRKLDRLCISVRPGKRPQMRDYQSIGNPFPFSGQALRDTHRVIVVVAYRKRRPIEPHFLEADYSGPTYISMDSDVGSATSCLN